MTRYAMAIDTRGCIGCGDCVIACKTENKVPEGLHRDRVVEQTRGRYANLSTEFRSERCNHCPRASCVSVCPIGASQYWRDTNIVLDDVMTPNPVTLQDTDTLHEAVEAMGRHHIGRIVVTDDAGRITGILTSADLIRLFYH